MKEFYTEFDEIQEALSRVRWDEPVMVYRNGMMLENQDEYAKIQKMLDCDKMQDAHRFLYDLDVENLREDEIEKINALYDMGVKKGYIDDSFNSDDECADGNCDCEGGECKDKVAEPEVKPEPKPAVTVAVPCWTVLYSATKDGDTKCGECFSNAISVAAAKADCLAKLSRFGYGNISILAIEAGDPDSAGMPEECGAPVDESGNPYAAGMKVVEGDVKADGAKKKTSKKTAKAVKEDDEEDSVDDTGDEGSDDSAEDEGSDNEGSDDSAEDEGSDDTEAGSDEGAEDGEPDEDNDEGSEDGDSDDEDGDAANEDKDGESEDEDAESEKDDEESDGKGEDDEGEARSVDDMTDEEKAAAKDEYRQAFRKAMLGCEFQDKSFNDLTLDEKVKFFEKISEEWTKADPKDLLSDKELDQLESVVVTAEE